MPEELRARVLEVIRELQWGTSSFCPLCFGSEPQPGHSGPEPGYGHTQDCKVAVVLARLEAQDLA